MIASVIVRGGRSLPSFFDPEEVRGATKVFRFEPDLSLVHVAITSADVPDVAPVATFDTEESIILDALRELAAKYSHNNTRAQATRATAESSARAERDQQEGALWLVTANTNDALEELRLAAERAAWELSRKARS